MRLVREDKGGRWSRRRFVGTATDRDETGIPISDPRFADRGHYTEFCFARVIPIQEAVEILDRAEAA